MMASGTRRDARGSESMTDPAARAELGRAALDHSPAVDPVHRFVRQRASFLESHDALKPGGTENCSIFVIVFR
jgi:hypothetical protein